VRKRCAGITSAETEIKLAEQGPQAALVPLNIKVVERDCGVLLPLILSV
jgi:hypothetical protein